MRTVLERLARLAVSVLVAAGAVVFIEAVAGPFTPGSAVMFALFLAVNHEFEGHRRIRREGSG